MYRGQIEITLMIFEKQMKTSKNSIISVKNLNGGESYNTKIAKLGNSSATQ